LGRQGVWSVDTLTNLDQEILQSGYLQVDETTLRAQDEQKVGKMHRVWVYLAPHQGLVLIDYNSSRSRRAPLARLDGYAGALQTNIQCTMDLERGRRLPCMGVGHMPVGIFTVHWRLRRIGSILNSWNSWQIQKNISEDTGWQIEYLIQNARKKIRGRRQILKVTAAR